MIQSDDILAAELVDAVEVTHGSGLRAVLMAIVDNLLSTAETLETITPGEVEDAAQELFLLLYGVLGKDANRDMTSAPPLVVGSAGGDQGCRGLGSSKLLGLSSGFSNTLSQSAFDDSLDCRSITSSKPCVPWLPCKLTAPPVTLG